MARVNLFKFQKYKEAWTVVEAVKQDKWEAREWKVVQDKARERENQKKKGDQKKLKVF